MKTEAKLDTTQHVKAFLLVKRNSCLRMIEGNMYSGPKTIIASTKKISGDNSQIQEKKKNILAPKST